MKTNRSAVELKSGWFLVIDHDDPSVWLNEVPNPTAGNGICVGVGQTVQTAVTAAVRALEEAVDELQQPADIHAPL